MKEDISLDTISRKKTKLEQQIPKKYMVLFHNDDYTTMEFVVFVLKAIFDKPQMEAIKIMMSVHLEGIAIVGIYTYEVATTGAHMVEKLAQKYEYPFKVTVEEVEDSF